MRFNVEKMKGISRAMTPGERMEIEARNMNREWLALSAEFALMVRKILRERKMTQRELAERMGVSCVQVTKLLSGKENIGLQTIAKVEKALGRKLVAFGDNGGMSDVSQEQAVFTQELYFMACDVRSEYGSADEHPRSEFFRLSTDKVLV